ncbi:MAG: hypothetical protein V1738_00285 [Patescibacteria group bacterium]
MYGLIEKALRERERPLRVAVIGTGWFGCRLIRELERTVGVITVAAVDLLSERAVKSFVDAGCPRGDVVLVSGRDELASAQAVGRRVCFADVNLLADLQDVDIFYECTGDLIGGATAAMIAADRGLPFVTVNSELDATVGWRLVRYADEHGTIYSNSDGDQPGCLARMIRQAVAFGFEPKVVGNCKGFIDVHQDPVGVKPYVLPGHDLNKVCAFADGTKQAMELAVVGNSFGYRPLMRGMHGPRTTKSELISTFDQLARLDELPGGHVDYVLGIDGVDQGAGVFVIAFRDEPGLSQDMQYLKKGAGPNYLFFRDYHLCHLEALSSLVEAASYATATLRPNGWQCDVCAFAKRDLKAGQTLDGLGGFDCYGLIETADIAREQRLLPAGLAEYATLKCAVAVDEPITYEMVELTDNLVTRLRREQDLLLAR